MIPVIRTERLTLRGPGIGDFEAVATFLASDRARYIGGPFTRHLAWRSFSSIVGQWELRGYGMWSVDETATGAFVGIVGLYDPEGWIAPEIGWWAVVPAQEGRGFITEAARAARRYAYEFAGWSEAFSVIAEGNKRSVRVATRLGATLHHTEDLGERGVALVYRHPSPAALREEGGQ